MRNFYFFILYSLGFCFPLSGQVYIGPSGISIEGDTYVKGDLVMQGDVEGPGWLVINPATATQLDGDGHSINRLWLSAPAGTELQSALRIGDSLQVQTGLLDLNDYVLSLDPEAHLIESSGGRITGHEGYIETTRDITALNYPSVGGLGLGLTSGQQLGYSIIRRGHLLHSDNGVESASRYYELIPTNDLVKVDLSMTFLGEELGGTPLSNWEMRRSADSGIFWEKQPGQLVPKPDLSLLNQTSPGYRWTLFPLTVNLPVEWISFTGQWHEESSWLDWTVKETNVSHYVIERSIDGRLFGEIGRKEVVPTPQETQTYQYEDDKARALGLENLYYRLKQIDLDGQFSYSSVIRIELPQASQHLSLWAYPNPIVGDVLQYKYSSGDGNPLTLELSNTLGQVLQHIDLEGTQGKTNSQQIVVRKLIPGYYYLYLRDGTQTATFKLVKE